MPPNPSTVPALARRHVLQVRGVEEPDRTNGRVGRARQFAMARK